MHIRMGADRSLVMNTFHANVLVVAVAALVGAQAHAYGGQAVSPTEARFAALDRDNNDALSLDEYAAEARAEFDAKDIDHNGNLTAEEMDVADPQADGEMSSAQKIALSDDNDDGVLSLDEYQASVEEQFERIDVNDDESITLDELKSGVPVQVPTP